MNQPRLLRLALLTAVCLAATAQADSLLPKAAGAGNPGTETGCTGALAAGGVISGEARVIFHDGSHAPVSVPVTPRDEHAETTPTATTTASTGAASGGGGAAIVLPSAEPAKPRIGPRWQTFLPGSLK